MVNPPTTINVEIYSDDKWDSANIKQRSTNKRGEWKLGTIADNDQVVIPIRLKHNITDCKRDNVHAKGGAIRFRASRVMLADHFPIELCFLFTVTKSQGTTIQKEIISLSEYPDSNLKFSWEKFYTVVSRIRKNPDM